MNTAHALNHQQTIALPKTVREFTSATLPTKSRQILHSTLIYMRQNQTKGINSPTPTTEVFYSESRHFQTAVLILIAFGLRANIQRMRGRAFSMYLPVQRCVIVGSKESLAYEYIKLISAIKITIYSLRNVNLLETS